MLALPQTHPVHGDHHPQHFCTLLVRCVHTHGETASFLPLKSPVHYHQNTLYSHSTHDSKTVVMTQCFGVTQRLVWSGFHYSDTVGIHPQPFLYTNHNLSTLLKCHRSSDVGPAPNTPSTWGPSCTTLLHSTCALCPYPWGDGKLSASQVPSPLPAKYTL